MSEFAWQNNFRMYLIKLYVYIKKVLGMCLWIVRNGKGIYYKYETLGLCWLFYIDKRLWINKHFNFYLFFIILWCTALLINGKDTKLVREFSPLVFFFIFLFSHRVIVSLIFIYTKCKLWGDIELSWNRNTYQEGEENSSTFHVSRFTHNNTLW